MKLPLGITLTLLLLLQSLQQVSTDIPKDWERDNGQLSSHEESTAEPTVENTQVTPQNIESSSGNEGQASGFFSYSENGPENQNPPVTEQMPSATDVLPTHETEEGSSDGPAATTPPPMVALTSSSEPLDTPAEHNEIETQDTASNNVTSEPDQTNQTALNETHPYSKPENTTVDSSHDESGSGYVPSDVPTKSPTTSTEDHEDQENKPYRTTEQPHEPPAYRTTKSVIPPAMTEDVTIPAPHIENSETNRTGSGLENRGDSAKGFSSDGKDNKKAEAWGVILVIGIIVGLIALTGFIILNRRNRRDFAHRKLVEEMSPDPVLRLDNSEPLDLKYDGFGYYNPGLHGDNIQMTNFPQGRSK